MIYKNDLSKQKKIERQSILKYILAWTLLMLVVLFLIFMLSRAKNFSLKVMLITMSVFFLIEAICFIFFVQNMLKKSRLLYPSYQLELTDEFIESTNLGFAKKILITEIKSINKISNNLIEVLGEGKRILISSSLVGFEEIKATLTKIMPIKIKLNGKIFTITLIVSALLYAASLFLRNVPMFFIFTPLFTIMLAISFVKFMNNGSYKLWLKIIMAVLYLRVLYSLVTGIATVVKKLYFN